MKNLKFLKKVISISVSANSKQSTNVGGIS